MKVIGVLTRVGQNKRGYYFVEIEGLRFDIGKDEDRFKRWSEWVDREVVAVVRTDRYKSNGKVFSVKRVISVRPVDGDLD